MTPYYADDAVCLFHGDLRQVVPQLGILGIRPDCVIADPPYEETDHTWDRWPAGWPGTIAAVTSSMWCFGSMRMFMARAGEFASWTVSHDLAWAKTHATGARADRFRRAHESVVHMYRGLWQDVHHEAVRESAVRTSRGVRHRRKAANDWHGHDGGGTWEDDGSRLATSVIESPNMRGRGPWHPNEKPGRVLDPLIRYSCPPGGLVLDPFAGAGSTGEAARLAGRRAVLIEVDEAYCERIALRLSQDILPIDTAREEAP